jgi:hypothetical protein
MTIRGFSGFQPKQRSREELSLSGEMSLLSSECPNPDDAELALDEVKRASRACSF